MVLAAAAGVMLLLAAILNALAPAGGPGRGRSLIVVAAVSGVALGALTLRARHRATRR